MADRSQPDARTPTVGQQRTKLSYKSGLQTAVKATDTLVSKGCLFDGVPRASFLFLQRANSPAAVPPRDIQWDTRQQCDADQVKSLHICLRRAV